MKLKDLLECCKPLLFEDGFEDYEYSAGGSFFLAKYQGHYYGITAAHCLHRRDKDALRLMFDELAPNEEKFMSLCCVHELNDPPTGSEDYTDVVFLEIDETQLSDSQRNSQWFLDFDDLIDRKVLLERGEKLVTRGFPNSLGGIDYDRHKIVTQSFTVDGTYEGRVDAPRIHAFRLSDLSQVLDINGISGSPVFLFHEDPRGWHYLFAGMIIQGSIHTGIVRFIDCGVIFAALKKMQK